MPEDHQESAGQKGEYTRFNEITGRPWTEDREVLSVSDKWKLKVGFLVDSPVTWIRENIVERFRGPKYYYYHQRFRRVPTIDECYTDDYACQYEANLQHKRDKKVDAEIVSILRDRFFNCLYYEKNINQFDRNWDLCLSEKKEFMENEANYFVKYGDIGVFSNVIDVYMKQKHRLIWERRQKEKEQNENGNGNE